jgi:hypothetical protein
VKQIIDHIWQVGDSGCSVYAVDTGTGTCAECHPEKTAGHVTGFLHTKK